MRLLRYPCLVLDHDDTVVQSEATINYPFFCEILRSYRPGRTITWEEYAEGCFHMGFVQMCREKFGFSQQELQEENASWRAYIQQHIPTIFPGIERIIQRQKAEGGLICVVSCSDSQNIARDYRHHFGLLPDAVFGWDAPEDRRKPNPYPLLEIMRRFSLRPEELLVVDDMKTGCEMARKADVPVAFAAWGRKDCPALCEEMERLCDFTFSSPEDLEKLLFLPESP